MRADSVTHRGDTGRLSSSPSTSCVDSADGTSGNLRCELPLPRARPLCAARTTAEVVANPTPFRTVTRRRSRRDPPASDDDGTSRQTTNKAKKPAHIIGSGESRLSGGIQAAPIRGRHSNTGGLFVSRLAPNTSSLLCIRFDLILLRTFCRV